MKLLKIIIGLLTLSIIAQFYFINKVNDSIELTYMNEKRYGIYKIDHDVFLLDKNTGRTWILLTSDKNGVTWDPLAYSIYVRNDGNRSDLLRNTSQNYNYTYFASTIEAYPKDYDYFSDEATAFVDRLIDDVKIYNPKYRDEKISREEAIWTLRHNSDKNYFDYLPKLREKELAPVIEQLKKEYESK